MNIADLLLKLIGGNSLGGNPAEFANQILGQIKKILRSLIILLIGSVLFCLIMGYLIDRVLTQMDLGAFSLTSSIVFLIVILCLDLAVILWSLKKISDSDEPKKEITFQPPQDSVLETAIAALILSFVNDRQAPPNAPAEEKGPLGPL
jgi:high-affinity Fe2+/Pb2+ permease